MTNKAKREWRGWVGFVDGVSYHPEYSDSYGQCRQLEVFARRKDAKIRFEDVRRITISEESKP